MHFASNNYESSLNCPADLKADYPTRLLQARDENTISELLGWYRPLLRDIASNHHSPLLKAKFDASDIVQQTCQDACENFKQFEAQSSNQFFAWLLKLLANNFADAKRHFIRAQKRSVLREQSSSKDFLFDDDRRVSIACPEQDIVHRERLHAVATAVKKLPDGIQQVLKWRFEDGMSYSQIGKIVGRSEDALRVSVRRCLKALRPEIFGDGSRL